MTYAQRLSIIVALDSYLILVAVFFGFQFVQEAALTVYTFEMLVISSLSLLIGHHLFSYIFHVYKQILSGCQLAKNPCQLVIKDCRKSVIQ
ncbi:hypothetical protein [Bacillus subtilis]|uniref:hypothetical protein n=1 Tax=Bacillus subtilis TaxID=1423 RepID=UPI00202A398A|nr:hypothetical protein [Bacillus subtilis]